MLLRRHCWNQTKLKPFFSFDAEPVRMSRMLLLEVVQPKKNLFNTDTDLLSVMEAEDIHSHLEGVRV